MEDFFVLMENEEEFNIINEFYNKYWGYTLNGIRGYSSENNIAKNNWIYRQQQINELINNGFTLLSYDEWYQIFIIKEYNYEIY